jgi:hypothetical protein
MLLAAIITCGALNTAAETLNPTGDGLLLSGMFFAKVETIREMLRSGDTANMRSKAPLQSTCMTLMCKDAALNIVHCVLQYSMPGLKSLHMPFKATRMLTRIGWQRLAGSYASSRSRCFEHWISEAWLFSCEHSPGD